MNVESTASLVEWLHENREPFRIVGNGTWLGAGRPVPASRHLSVQPITGVVEYVPGDLTMTVRAGTRHAELDAITRREGQWLGLDPVMCAGGTIGATIATASAGPLVHSIGAVRDIVLGLETVAGNGIVSRGGGKVVKNVAGYDLVRLHTGAFGTLGIITEVSLRLAGASGSRRNRRVGTRRPHAVAGASGSVPKSDVVAADHRARWGFHGGAAWTVSVCPFCGATWRQ